MQQLSACGYVCFFVLYDCRLCARFHALVSFSAAKTQDQMQSRFFLNVVVGQRATVFQLLAGKNQTLLIGRNALFVLNLLLDLLNVVARLDVERNRLSCECFDKDLHFCQSWLVVVSVDRLGTFFFQPVCFLCLIILVCLSTQSQTLHSIVRSTNFRSVRVIVCMGRSAR